MSARPSTRRKDAPRRKYAPANAGQRAWEQGYGSKTASFLVRKEKERAKACADARELEADIISGIRY